MAVSYNPTRGFPSECRSRPPDAAGLRHEYARHPIVNADKSMVVVLIIVGDDRELVQVREIATGKLLRVIPVDGDTESSWRSTDPDLLIYRFMNQVWRLHVCSEVIDTFDYIF
jgi:hypothetical protein